MSMYKQFQTDPSIEEKGIVLDYGEFRVTVARAGGANRQYQKVLNIKVKPYQRAIQAGLLGQEQANEILCEVFAETVIKGWETKLHDEWHQGIESKDGDLLPPTKANVAATLKALPQLFEDIRAQASDYQLFRASILEDNAGN